ncbi:YSIRK-type signal peptide-containing protein [Macrococcoides canis]|uniref:YSIRK-type signal peptide-containing protein n=1 Tax=Macrococcoides canis TaxID=1855823 RepID=A0AAE6X475_9STAP|nr:SdrD B-like domain-containing protein [Macrococcus canis]QIH79280.1 YSIRK-type signal peptide-containing protein [Macrococcus canis]
MKKMNFLANKQNKYSIRKFTVGTTSILIGSLMFLGSEGNVRAAEVSTETVTTETPTTEAPTTEEVTTESVTTEAPTTEEVTTESVTTEAPTTEEVTTESVTTEAPTTEKATTESVTTEAPTTEEVTTETVTTEAPTTEEVTTETVTTEAPTTKSEGLAPAIDLSSTVNDLNTVSTIAEKEKVLTEVMQDAGISSQNIDIAIKDLNLNNNVLNEEEVLSALLKAIASEQNTNEVTVTPVSLTTNRSLMNSISLGSLNNINTLVSQGLITVNNVSTIDSGYSNGSATVEAADRVVKPNLGESFKVDIDFTIDPSVQSGDTFTLSLPNEATISDLHPEVFDVPDLVGGNGKVIATGVYDYATKSITYTFNSEVLNQSDLSGSISLGQYIDRNVVSNEATVALNYNIDGNSFVQPAFDVKYPSTANVSELPSNIDTTYVSYDENTGELKQLIYYNPLQIESYGQTLYVQGFESKTTPDSSAAKIDTNTQFKIYEIPDGYVVPDSLIINDYSGLVDVSNNYSWDYYAGDFAATRFTDNYTPSTQRYLIEVTSYVDLQLANSVVIQQEALMGSYPQPPVNGEQPIAAGHSNIISTIQSGSNITGTYAIGDFIFEDTDKDGTQTGSAPIAGVTVTLKDEVGNVVGKPIISGKDGSYLFTGLTNGNYTVEFSKPAGYTPILPNQGGDTANDSDITADANGVLSAPVTINNANALTIDAGFVKEQPTTPTYTLGNYTFLDLNGNGIQDAEDAPFEGVKVSLFEADGVTPVYNDKGEAYSLYTDANGIYEFTGLSNGDYVVKFDLTENPGLVGTVADVDNNDSDGLDSDGIRKDLTPIYFAKATIQDENNLTVDFGLNFGYEIGDYVFEDQNHDGIQDPTEPGIAGVTVTLTKPDGTTVTTTTDSNGGYTFTDLPKGTYTVTFDTPPNYVPVQENQGTDDTKDSDPVFNSTKTQGSVTVDLTDNNPTIDAGFEKAVYKIGDRVWEDNNNNDILDAGDTGIAGVTVTLKDASGNVIATQVTDANGNYLFEGLTNGDYTVEFGTPADSAFVPVKDNVGTSDMDSDPSTVAVTINNADNLTIDRGFEKLLTIGDKVFEDQNHDGIQDPTEPGIPGVTVTLTKPDGTTVTTTTDSNGGYTFTDLPKGTYTVTFDTPPNYVPVQENQGTDDTKDSDPVFNSTKTQGSVTVDLTDNNPTIDAGFEKAVYKIGDRVWEDNNNNDILDAGDTGIAGVTVTLKDASGNVIATQVTDANGNYLFEGLTNGDYTVEFGTPADSAFVPVKDNVGTSDMDSDPSTVAVTINNADNLTIDRGFEKLLTIGDKVFEDQNHDGIQDPTEPGIPGVTVTLTKPDGTTVTTTTDSNGGYTFTDLPKGTYTVTFDTPPNYVPVQENQGTDDTKDSDPVFNSTKTQGSVTVDLTDNNPTIDAGFEKAVYKIGDRVWEDNNNNDILDAGDTGIAGVTVTLKDASGNVIATQVTDANGNYLFEGLPNGDYTVEFGTPADSAFVPVKDNVGTTDVDSDPSTVAVTINNADDLTIDRGFEKLLTIGDKVFEDQNHDGIQDPTEPGIPGVTVTLTKPDGTTVTTTTDSNGGYTFTDLPKGTYTVTFDTPLNYVPVQENQGTDDTKDSDPVFNSTKTQGSVTVDLTDNNPTIDAGFEKAVYKIGDRVWEDNNNNDIQDAGDTGIAGVTVTLKDASGNVIATQVTDANGNYLFEGLTNGDYTVEFGTPADSAFVPVKDNVGTTDVDSDSSTVAVTINNADDLTIDRGFEKVTPPVTPVYKIGDRIWEDNNNNDIQDAGDTGIAGVTVTLKDASGNVIATQVTDANGNYLFEGLANGDYTVEFGTPADSAFVPVKDNVGTTDVDSDPSTVAVTINNADNLTIDRGFEKVTPPVTPVYKIGDRVWEDNNNNDIQDAGDTGIAGVTVTLKDASGNVIATQVTDENGNYLFEGLPNGDYTVEFGTPADSVLVPVKDNVGTSDVDSDKAVVAVTINNADDLTIDRGFEKPEITPEPKPEPQPEPKPEPQPEPKPEPQPEPKPEPQPEPKSEVQPELQQKPDTQVSKRDGIKHAHPTDSHHGKYDNAGKAHEVKELPDTGESNNNGLNAALALAVGGFTLMLTRRKREE